MTQCIKILPDGIANQIAAGEVIQRPASAVKELLENAVDAGATDIRLIVKDAGKALIQVVDNGVGMSEMDARLCFERHATSKIEGINDLYDLTTKGFRGEALASVASVAQVELKTRTAEMDIGTVVRIEGNEVKSQEECHAPIGTNISIKNLFFNVPARRKFLKSDQAEFKNIKDEFERVALAHPELGFQLYNDKDIVLHLQSGNLRQRIVALMSNVKNEHLVPLYEEGDFLTVHGFTGKSEAARRTRGGQYLLVNNRFIKSPYLHHAVMKAYDRLIPEGSYPFYVLLVDIAPDRIDINVHPSKQEIKFDDEKIVYTFVHMAVKHALAQHHVTPVLDFDQDTSFNNMAAFKTSPDREGVTNRSTQTEHRGSWEALFGAGDTLADFTSDAIKQAAPQVQMTFNEEEEDHVDMKPIQVLRKYILTPIRSGFILIDQQAAHKRILFDRFLRRLEEKKQNNQQILFSERFELSNTESSLLLELIPDLKLMGFDIRHFGDSSFVLQGVPEFMEQGEEYGIIEEMLAYYQSHQQQIGEERNLGLARMMAEKTSMRGQKTMKAEEMRNLIDQLFECQDPYIGIDGSPTVVSLDDDAILSLFRS